MRELSSTPFIDKLHLALKNRAAALIDAGISPHIAVILVGEDPESIRYVATKEERAKEDGIIVSLYHVPENTPFEELVNTLQFLAADSEVHGILVQLPLPKRFSTDQLDALLAIIPAEKDVDGLKGDWEFLSYAPTALSRLAAYQRGPLPPMVLAVMSLLDHYHVDLTGQKIVIVGKGRLVGQPLESYFRKLSLDVIAVDEETPDILSITKEADVLITGTGETDLITYQWVKEGATVIDCARDVHTDSVSQIAGALSPAKGGIGPLTVAWLLNNALNSAEESAHA